jgi:hypothetical protein
MRSIHCRASWGCRWPVASRGRSTSAWVAPAGCAHLTALVHAIAPVVRQGAGVTFRGTREQPDPAQDLWFVNTCQAWRENGPLHTRLVANDVEGLRQLSAHRKS